MATFVWDMSPHRYNLLMTWSMAKALQQKAQDVYYIQHADTDFTLALIKQHLNCSVIYPDDFEWLRPNLVLLDCLLVERAPFYRERGIPYIFVAMQSPGRATNLDADIPVLCLPPVPLPWAEKSSDRSLALIGRMEESMHQGQDSFIVSLLEKGNCVTEEQRKVYRCIRKVASRHPDYRFLLWVERSQALSGLSVFPPNVEVYRQVQLDGVFPNCKVALTTDHPDAWLECTFAGLPFIPMSDKEAKQITPLKLEWKITETLRNRDVYRHNEEEMCRYFERENQKLDIVADQLIALAERKQKERKQETT